METGIQISSLKPLLLDAAQVREAFRHVAALGCHTVQLQWIDPSVAPEEIAGALREAGLRSVSVQDFYVSIAADPDDYLRLNALTGGEWLCVSRVPEHFRSPEGLTAYARELHDLSERAAALGQRLCFHPVADDYRPVGGVCPVDALLEALPELQLCLDLYHLSRAGQAMPAWIRAHAGRMEMVHFKDERDGALVPAGQGEIPWEGVVGACLEAGVPLALVEQERWDRDPYECLGEALRWLRGEIAKQHMI